MFVSLNCKLTYLNICEENRRSIHCPADLPSGEGGKSHTETHYRHLSDSLHDFLSMSRNLPTSATLESIKLYRYDSFPTATTRSGETTLLHLKHQ